MSSTPTRLGSVRPALLVIAGLGVTGLGVLGAGGCLFAPQLEPYGYTSCETDADCEAGRDCHVGLCAPPPWMDGDYGQRRAIYVDNPSTDETLRAGTPVPVVVGEGGLVPIDQVGADARFTRYDRAADSGEEAGEGWSDLTVFRELAADHLTQWTPVPADVPPGGREVLSWMYRDHAEGTVALVEDATAVFERYDVFANADFGLDANFWRVDGTGDVTTEAGRVVLRDNTQLFGLQRITPPFELTMTGTIIGELCDALFIGVQGDDFVGTVPPYAGFFFRQGLEVALDVVPTADSQPAPLVFESIEQPTAKHRFSIAVNEGRVRLSVDDQLLVERADLTPPMADDELVVTVDVDGDGCVFELTKVWLSRPPFVAPTVSVGEAIDYVDFD